MKIAFLHEGKSYMPEVSMYVKYLNEHTDIEAVIVENSKDLTKDTDIVWKPMGLDRSRSHDYALIHEYNSLTVGKNARLKDFLKRTLNTKPDGRIFLNEKVRDVFNFKDTVPYIYRDMGINKEYYNISHIKKEYDFVYIGTMDPSRELDKMLKPFAENQELSIILIGTPDENLYKTFNKYDNITFTGRVPYEELPQTAAKATYGMNYIPDVFPFNRQTSTKMLEYSAMGMKIVTTDYEWVNDFEKEYNGKFFKLNDDLSNLTRENLENFEFSSPALKEREWMHYFDTLGLEAFIRQVYDHHKRKVKR